MTQLLTHSRMESFKGCRKRCEIAYEIGWRPKADAKPLRMGSAYQTGLEYWEKTKDLAVACDAVRDYYQSVVMWDEREWDIEKETILRLLCGYVWRWGDDGIEHIATEQKFDVPLVNPATGKASRIWRKAGKFDGIVKLEDKRLAVKENKLLGEDISTDSTLLRRLRLDHQLSGYMIGARESNFDVVTVLFDVTRKPTILPNDVPVLDELEMKIVLDAKGERVQTAKGLWRQTADKEKGYVLQKRPMTVAEWGEKLADDIVARPEFYYARHEIPRLDSDLDEYRAECWDVAKTIRDAQLESRWYRTVNRNTCPFCCYFDLCTTGYDEDTVPEGFVKLTNKNPELGDESVQTPTPAPIDVTLPYEPS